MESRQCGTLQSNWWRQAQHTHAGDSDTTNERKSTNKITSNEIEQTKKKLLLRLPSDNVWHELQRWSLISIPDRRKPRKYSWRIYRRKNTPRQTIRTECIYPNIWRIVACATNIVRKNVYWCQLLSTGRHIYISYWNKFYLASYMWYLVNYISHILRIHQVLVWFMVCYVLGISQMKSNLRMHSVRRASVNNRLCAVMLSFFTYLCACFLNI